MYQFLSNAIQFLKIELTYFFITKYLPKFFEGICNLKPLWGLSVFDNFVGGRYRGRYSSTEKRNMYLAFITLTELFTKMAFSVRLF